MPGVNETKLRRFSEKPMKDERQQRDPEASDEVVLARHVESLDVLPGDLRVRTDVDDVDPAHILSRGARSSWRSDRGRQASCQARPRRQPGIATSRRPSRVEPIEDVLDSLSLEVLEPRVDSC